VSKPKYSRLREFAGEEIATPKFEAPSKKNQQWKSPVNNTILLKDRTLT
jgi:hypothetical protein